MKTLAFHIEEEFTILVHGEKGPSPRSWDHLLAATRATKSRAAIVSSGGGGLSAEQRKQLISLPHVPPTAVFVNGVNIHNAVTSVGLFSPHPLRSFVPGDWVGVASFLRLRPEVLAQARAKMDELRAQLGLPPLP